MSQALGLRSVIHNLLETGDLSFLDFVEVALYHPEAGYYQRPENPIGRTGDFVTSPVLSPVFSFALSRLIQEFLSRNNDGVSTVVDIGCGDGRLINSLYEQVEGVRFYGVDRALDRVAVRGPQFVTTIDQVPRDGAHLLICNELFDAFPFARLVMRGEHLHELWVTERDGKLDWTEHEASVEYEEYFAERGIELADGQFADVSLEWAAYYSDLCRFLEKGLIVTFDYGYPEKQLFLAQARRFGTAAVYSQHRVSRDLLDKPGEQDITAHINFTDLIRAGESSGLRTLFFDRQAKFLLALGATDHELFTPVEKTQVASLAEALALRERKEEARRLVLPDGIGEDIRVLVQSRGMNGEPWIFQRKLF